MGRTTGQSVGMLTIKPRTSKYEATVNANPIEITVSDGTFYGPGLRLPF